MKAIPATKYQCETCKTEYASEGDALRCESRPIMHDRGVKIGDEVLITGGDGKGMRCKVESVFILSRDWGHYAWERYWHTVGVSGPVIGSYGHRMLPFDSYEPITTAQGSAGES